MTLRLQLPEGFLQDEPKTLIVSASRKRLWAVLLDLTAEFQRVCDKYGLCYCAAGGTLIGALRHKGFIPWDDDVDLIMPRADFERLCEVAPREFTSPYFWQTETTDPFSARGHAQLRNSATTGILKDEMLAGRPLFSFNQGVFIDIFPLDHVPDDPAARAALCQELSHLRRQTYVARLALAYSRLSPVRFLTHPSQLVRWLQGWWYRLGDVFCGRNRVARLAARIERVAQSYNTTACRQCAAIAFHPDCAPNDFLETAWFTNLTRVPFEMLSLPIPQHAETMLEHQYGNWHEHVLAPSMHGGLLVDVDRPYTEYFEKR